MTYLGGRTPLEQVARVAAGLVAVVVGLMPERLEPLAEELEAALAQRFPLALGGARPRRRSRFAPERAP